MYFAGEYSKYEEGEVVLVKHKTLPRPLKCKIVNIGILGGKLSDHVFLYHLVDDNGKEYDVIEDNLYDLREGETPDGQQD